MDNQYGYEHVVYLLSLDTFFFSRKKAQMNKEIQKSKTPMKMLKTPSGMDPQYAVIWYDDARSGVDDRSCVKSRFHVADMKRLGPW